MEVDSYYGKLNLSTIDFDAFGWDSTIYLAIQSRVVDIIHGTDASIGSIILNCINWDTEATTYADLVPAVRQILQDQFPDYRDLEQRLGQRLQFTVSETPATTTERGTTTVESTYFTPKAPNDPVFVKQRRENVLLKRELKKVKQEQDTSMRSLDLDTKQTMRVIL